MGMGICSGNVRSFPLVHVWESPEFSSIVNLDKTGWPRCLLWHGWLPALSGNGRGTSWANVAVDVAKNQLLVAFGSYVGAHSVPYEGFQLGEGDPDIADVPFVWSDGSLIVDKRFLGSESLVRGFMLMFLAKPGFIGGGVILTCCLPWLMEHFKVVPACILGLTT